MGVRGNPCKFHLFLTRPRSRRRVSWAVEFLATRVSPVSLLRRQGWSPSETNFRSPGYERPPQCAERGVGPHLITLGTSIWLPRPRFPWETCRRNLCAGPARAILIGSNDLAQWAFFVSRLKQSHFPKLNEHPGSGGSPMKLTLPPSMVLQLASLLPYPGEVILEHGRGLFEESSKTLHLLASQGCEVATRKDLVAVLHARGVVEDPIIGGPRWGDITAALHQESDPEGRRGYYRLRDVAKLAPLPNSEKASPSKTRDFIEEQIKENDLLNRLAYSMKRSYPREDLEDLQSFVGLWLAKWAADGECDKYIEAGKPPKVGVFLFWLKQKHTHALNRGGQDALLREFKGVRTGLEVRRRREGSLEDYIHPDSRKAVLEVRQVYESVRGSGKTSGTIRRIDFTRAGMDPESVIMTAAENQEAYLEERQSLARDLIRVQRGKAADRYARVFDLYSKGASAQEVASAEELTEKAAKHLIDRVRSYIKCAPEILSLSLRVLRLISQEPYSTETEIFEDLSADGKKVGQALNLLVTRGLVQEAQGRSFAATSCGSDALLLGHL